MYKLMSILIVVTPVLLSGCAGKTGADAQWISQTTTDKFTDATTCTVIQGPSYTTQGVYDFTSKYSAFVSKSGSDVRVGVKGVGKYPAPMGDVQLRIDDNTPVMMSISETSLDFAPNISAPPLSDDLSDEAKEGIRIRYAAVMTAMAQSLSLYTAVQGPKAQALVSQMRAGKELVYRKVGKNQSSSEPSVVGLDSSFRDALDQCGISDGR